MLEPQAVADLMPQFVGAFNARANDEGRGTFCKTGGGTRLGEKITDERVTIFSDPDGSRSPRAAVRRRRASRCKRIVWIENGILKNFSYSTLLGAEAGQCGDDGAVADAVAAVAAAVRRRRRRSQVGRRHEDAPTSSSPARERGILVTHFFYIRFLDQRTVLLTGLTRDGTFLIENGKITQALKNFRWNESPLFMLNKIEEIGRAERTAAGQVMPSFA